MLATRRVLPGAGGGGAEVYGGLYQSLFAVVTQFESVGIGFKDGNLQAMELHDVFGNVTLLTFSNIQKNPPIKGDTFKFTVPKGADVING